MTTILMILESNTFQQDLQDILTSLLEQADKTLYLSLYNNPEHMLENNLKPALGEEKTQAFHAIDATTNKKSENPKIAFVGGDASLTQIKIEITEQTNNINPKYFVFDGLGAIIPRREQPEEFIKDVINQLNNQKINTIILVNNSKYDEPLTKVVEQMADQTIFYEKLKKQRYSQWNT